jgi:hypothetical protein
MLAPHLAGHQFIAYMAEARRHAMVVVIAHLDVSPIADDSGLINDKMEAEELLWSKLVAFTKWK